MPDHYHEPVQPSVEREGESIPSFDLAPNPERTSEAYVPAPEPSPDLSVLQPTDESFIPLQEEQAPHSGAEPEIARRAISEAVGEDLPTPNLVSLAATVSARVIANSEKAA